MKQVLIAMMLALLGSIVLTGCERPGRYQLVTGGEPDVLYRLDTQTGLIAKCIQAKNSPRPVCSDSPINF